MKLCILVFWGEDENVVICLRDSSIMLGANMEFFLLLCESSNICRKSVTGCWVAKGVDFTGYSANTSQVQTHIESLLCDNQGWILLTGFLCQLALRLWQKGALERTANLEEKEEKGPSYLLSNWVLAKITIVSFLQSITDTLFLEKQLNAVCRFSNLWRTRSNHAFWGHKAAIKHPSWEVWLCAPWGPSSKIRDSCSS